MQIDVEDIKRLAISPGEVLVARIANEVKARLPEGTEVLVTTANVELSVLTRV